MPESLHMFQPRFTITNKLLRAIGRIEAAKEVIEKAPLVPAWERQFKQEAVTRSVHFSTHIEGNALNFSEVKKIVEGREGEVFARERDIQEILNYRKAMEFIDKMAEGGGTGQPAVLSAEQIEKIHAILTERIIPDERRGAYRQGQADSINSRTLEVSLRYLRPDEVPARVEAFVDWFNSPAAKELHSVLKSGVTHHELVRIHPFDEANGRTARVMATLSLFLDGYNIKNFFSLEEYYDSHSTDYYQALSSIAEEDPDLTPWLEYFADGLAVELARVEERVLKLSRDAKLKKTIGQIALNERQEQIVEYLQDYGKFANTDFEELFPEISEDTVLRDIKVLIDKGLVKKEGSTKAARYILS